MFEGGQLTGRANVAADAPAPDILRREVDQRRLRARQRIAVLGEMTRGIAHDFRNILAMIGSGLSLAERGLARGERLDAYLLASREGVERGLRLTSRLLRLATPQNPQADLYDLNDLIRELGLFVKYGAGAGNRVVFDLEETLPFCLVDPSQFSSAILNLVINARDAMPDGGEIRIGTRSFRAAERNGSHLPGLYVIVRVADNGQGMSADVLSRIFDPCFTTKGHVGTGLGVPQVNALMQLVGGEVRVQSEPGTGTSFELIFPALDDTCAARRQWTDRPADPDQVQPR